MTGFTVDYTWVRLLVLFLQRQTKLTLVTATLLRFLVVDGLPPTIMIFLSSSFYNLILDIEPLIYIDRVQVEHRLIRIRIEGPCVVTSTPLPIYVDLHV